MPRRETVVNIKNSQIAANVVFHSLFDGVSESKQPRLQHRVQMVNENAEHYEEQDDNKKWFNLFFDVHEAKVLRLMV